jgi:hypothetical protein
LAALAWLLVPPRACSPIAGAVPGQPPRVAALARVRPGSAGRPAVWAEEHLGGAPAAVPPPEERAELKVLAQTHPPPGSP